MIIDRYAPPENVLAVRLSDPTLNETHLRWVLRTYSNYYNRARPHQGIQQQFPIPQTHPNTFGIIQKRKGLGGARNLRLIVERLRRYWLVQLGIVRHTCFLLDTKPVPVVGVKRSNRHSDIAGSADYGHCASRSLKYFGYKRVALTTLEGIPVVYDLVPANTDEREAAEAVLDYLSGCEIIGDKGFLGDFWQSLVRDQTSNRIWTPKRSNQFHQNSESLVCWLKSVRERIEGVFHELTDTGRNLEKLLAKTVVGLATRIIAKITSHALRHLFRL